MTLRMVNDLFCVENKIVVITGGLGQLGQQFSQALVDRGAKVAIFDRQTDRQNLSKCFNGSYTEERLLVLSVDITRRDSIQDGLAQVNAKWGVPFGLINSAALDSPPDSPLEENGPFETYPESSWDKIMEVNVKGVFLCCQVIGGQMAAENRGTIVNIGSTYGMVSPDQRIYQYRRRGGETFFKPIAYSASKASLLNMTRYLATYWADRNVRVNTLTFAGVFNNQDQEFLSGYCAKVPMGRMARKDEYNGAVIFFMSEASSYMTGSNMVIDGGFTAW